MKEKRIIARLLCAVIVLSAGLSSFRCSALSLNSYTYSKPGEVLSVPEPYTLSELRKYDGFGSLNGARDIFSAENGNIYIADTDNNRVLIFGADGEPIKEIKEYPLGGEMCAFNAPSGLCVRDGLYIADTKNSRIAVFTESGEFLRVINAPQSDTLRSDFQFQPSRLAVNPGGYVYAVGEGMIEGIAEFDSSGNFVRFAASNETAPDMLEYFWTRTFASSTQKDISALFLSEEFNSVVIDEKGYFLTVSTTAGINRYNTKGDIITRTSGDFLLVGDYKTTETEKAQTLQDTEGDGVSKLIDVANSENGIYSVADSVYQRIFTYDYEGNLLWAFGVSGNTDGAFKSISALTYDTEGRLLVLDSELNRVSVFNLTAFGRQAQAGAMLRYQGDNKTAAREWADILRFDSGYPLGYLGKGMLCYDNGEYEDAMRYFRLADNKQFYSKAFVYERRQNINTYFPYIMSSAVLLAVVLSVIGTVKKKKKVRAGAANGGAAANTLPRQLLYSKYTVLHPFKAFWDIKTENRATVLSATVLLIILIAVNLLKSQSTGFLFSTTDFGGVNVFKEIRKVLFPVLLWCVANWGLTTLMDGEGSFRQIYIVTAYSVSPLILTQLISWGLSHALSLNEGAVISVITAAGTVLAVFLMFVGTVTIHQYSFGKNLFSWLLTLVAIAAIIFLLMICVEMTDWVITFIKTLGREIILAVS